MELTLALLACCVMLLFAWYMAEQFYTVAKMKGHSERKYFWIPFWLGILGYMLVIALPDRGCTEQVVTDELPDL